jgi:uncharacterized protein (TIGR03086 family)
MVLPEQPAERHRAIAGTFSDRVRGVSPDGWGAPAPVAGWTARDVIDHLSWFSGYLSGSYGLTMPAGPSAAEDPAAAWLTQAAAVQAVLDDADHSGQTVDDPHMGSLPLGTLIDRIYTADVFMHTWDLARATGQDDRLDPDFCAELLAGMQGIEEVLRASGQYGPAVPVPDDADVQTRMLGFIGRDPEWRPPGREGR